LTVEAQLLQTPVYADFSLNFVDVQQSPIEFSGISPLVHIPLYSKSSQDEFTVYEINITANSPIAPSYSGLVNISAFSDDILVLTLVPNQAPIVTLVEPYSGQRVMETNVITATAQISDDINSLDELTIVWNVYDLSGEKILTGGFGEQYNVTDLTAGYYLVEITVVDTFGATTTASVDIEFTLLDSDGDWTGSCDSQTWFDATTGKSCGPNLYDADDDNDGISDAKDHFPLDVCAWQDSDGDGQPNDLNCPEGTSTWLTADMDDDGDGIPDSLEGQQSNDGDENLNAIMLVVIVFIVVALLFMMRIRKGGGTDFSIDSTHL